MRALSASDFLTAWERGFAQGPLERALTLLAIACPETSRDALAALSIGRRDASLLTLRERTFGPAMASLVVCPRCSERVELTFSVADVQINAAAESPQAISLTISGYDLQVRPPNSLDVIAVAGQPDPGRVRQALFERCVLAARCNGEAIAPELLPAAVVDAAAKRMEQADPQADVRLDILCASCGHRWDEAFDIVSFFWSEIDAHARRILRDVHVLALAYGWREQEILALSPWRRQLYLEMVGA